MNEPQQDDEKPHMTRQIHIDSGLYTPALFANGHKLAVAHLKGPKAFREAMQEILARTKQIPAIPKTPISSEAKSQPSPLATPPP
jgi:hypothetical protein